VADALNTQIARAFPRIKAHVWFNVPFDGVDWRIETSQASIDAWKNGIAFRIYASNQYGSLSVSPIPEP